VFADQEFWRNIGKDTSPEQIANTSKERAVISTLLRELRQHNFRCSIPASGLSASSLVCDYEGFLKKPSNLTNGPNAVYDMWTSFEFHGEVGNLIEVVHAIAV
jgi:hypothetical protein